MAIATTVGRSFPLSFQTIREANDSTPIVISIRLSGDTHSLRGKVSRFTHITPGLDATIVFVSKRLTRVKSSRDHFAIRHTPQITAFKDLGAACVPKVAAAEMISHLFHVHNLVPNTCCHMEAHLTTVVTD